VLVGKPLMERQRLAMFHLRLRRPPRLDQHEAELVVPDRQEAAERHPD
jgi:hypothetical protein